MNEPDDPGLVARADQAEAAAREVAMGVTTAPDTVVLEVSEGRAPAWLVKALARHNQLVNDGEAYACPHLADHPDRLGVEVVTHLAVWAPGRMACTDCTAEGIFGQDLDEVENQTCDICRSTGGTIVMGLYQSDAWIIHYGLCLVCHFTKADV